MLALWSLASICLQQGSTGYLRSTSDGEATMPGKQVDREKKSAINDIVLNAAKQIRQRRIDEYWFNRLHEQDVLASIQRSPITSQQYRKMNPQAKTHLLMEIHPLIVNENGFSGWVTVTDKDGNVLSPIGIWNPLEDKELPPSALSHAEFANQAGIDPEDWEELHGRRQLFTVEQMVKVAFAGDVDPMYMLTPNIEFQEHDLYMEENFKLLKPIRVHRWIMWVKGMLHLPGQNPETYRIETSLPPLEVIKVVKEKTTRKNQLNQDLSRKANSTVSAFLSTVTVRKTKSNFDYEEQPYTNVRGTIPYTTEIGVQLTRAANKLSSATKTGLQLGSRNKKSDKPEMLHARYLTSLRDMATHFKLLSRIIRALGLN
jgi:hypothetical protein